MWNLSNLAKLKDLAVDIVAPAYEEEADLAESRSQRSNTSEGSRSNAAEVSGGLQPLSLADETPRRAPAPPKDSPNSIDPTSQSHSEARVVGLAASPESSGPDRQPSTSPAATPQPLHLPSSKPSPAVRAGAREVDGDESEEPARPQHEVISALELQVSHWRGYASQLEEKVAKYEAYQKDMELRVRQYSEEVRAAHDKTVAYYEHQISALRASKVAEERECDNAKGSDAVMEQRPLADLSSIVTSLEGTICSLKEEQQQFLAVALLDVRKEMQHVLAGVSGRDANMEAERRTLEILAHKEEERAKELRQERDMFAHRVAEVEEQLRMSQEMLEKLHSKSAQEPQNDMNPLVQRFPAVGTTGEQEDEAVGASPEFSERLRRSLDTVRGEYEQKIAGLTAETERLREAHEELKRKWDDEERLVAKQGAQELEERRTSMHGREGAALFPSAACHCEEYQAKIAQLQETLVGAQSLLQQQQAELEGAACSKASEERVGANGEGISAEIETPTRTAGGMEAPHVMELELARAQAARDAEHAVHAAWNVAASACVLALESLNGNVADIKDVFFEAAAQRLAGAAVLRDAEAVGRQAAAAAEQRIAELQSMLHERDSLLQELRQAHQSSVESEERQRDAADEAMQLHKKLEEITALEDAVTQQRQIEVQLRSTVQSLEAAVADLHGKLAQLQQDSSERESVASDAVCKLKEQLQQERVAAVLRLNATLAEERQKGAAAAQVAAEQSAASALLRDQLHVLEGELEAVRRQRDSVREQLDQTSRKPRETETADQQNLSILLAVRKELEEKNAHFQELHSQLRRLLLEHLLRSGVDLDTYVHGHAKPNTESSGKSRSSSENGGSSASCGDSPSERGAGVSALSLSDIVSIQISEHAKVKKLYDNATLVHREWERTYEQAREVNSTLNGQINDAWKTIGALREEVSVKAEATQNMKMELARERQKFTSLQTQYSDLSLESQRVKEELDKMRESLRATQSGEIGKSERVEQLEAEREDLQQLLQQKEEELESATLSVENLQRVLQTLKESKSRDVEERTHFLQSEVDHLRAALAVREEAKGSEQTRVEELAQQHKKQLALKNIEISALQRKLTELKRIIEETSSQIHGDMMIDKRVISYLIVNYIHAFVAGKNVESNDIIKVLSGLLRWDDAMQEKAGLLPGPTNPKPTQGRGLVGGLVHSVFTGRPRAARTDAPRAAASSERKSIAEMWVDFLMTESESAAASGETGAGASSTDVQLPVATSLGASVRREEEPQSREPPLDSESQLLSQPSASAAVAVVEAPKNPDGTV